MAKKKDRTKSLSIGKFSISTSKNKDMDSGKKSKFLTVKVGDKTLYSRNKTKQKSTSDTKIGDIVTPIKEVNYPVKLKYRPNTADLTKKIEYPTYSKRKKTKESTLNIGLKGDRGNISIGRKKEKYSNIDGLNSGYKEKARSISATNNEGNGASYPTLKKKGVVGITSYNPQVIKNRSGREERKIKTFVTGMRKQKGTSKKSK